MSLALKEWFSGVPSAETKKGPAVSPPAETSPVLNVKLKFFFPPAENSKFRAQSAQDACVERSARTITEPFATGARASPEKVPEDLKPVKERT